MLVPVTTLSGGTSLATTAPAPMTDGDAGRDRGRGTDPHVVLDDDRCVREEVVPLVELDGVAPGAQRDPRPDQDAVADGDTAQVEEEAPLVDEHPVAERRAQPVVAVEGRQDRQGLGDRTTEDLRQQRAAAAEVLERQRVQTRRQLHDGLHALREGTRLRGPVRYPLLVPHEVDAGTSRNTGASARQRPPSEEDGRCRCLDWSVAQPCLRACFFASVRSLRRLASARVLAAAR